VIPIDLLGLVLLGIAASLGLGILTGGLLAFGEARFEVDADERAGQSSLIRHPWRMSGGARLGHRRVLRIKRGGPGPPSFV
jgi:hypothetical protein